MKYYIETIPASLAEKLKGKGMPIIFSRQTLSEDNKFPYEYIPTYAEVFDWLMERDMFVIIEPSHLKSSWYHATISRRKLFMACCEESTWHEAANAAIEKALTLI